MRARCPSLQLLVENCLTDGRMLLAARHVAADMRDLWKRLARDLGFAFPKVILTSIGMI